MDNRLCIAVCEHFAQETAAVAESEDLDDVVFLTFPAHCKKPEEAWESLAEVLNARGEMARKVLVLGSCRAKVGNPPGDLATCEVRAAEQCFHLVTNRGVVDAHLRSGVHLLTPGWLARWRDYMDEWGFSREMAHEFFGESTTRLVLLDTGIDVQACDRLREFAAFVGLPSEVVPVGLDVFRSFLIGIVQEWRLERERRKMAEYAMVFDILGSLPHARTEATVITQIMDLFQMLYAPASLVYVPFTDGNAGDVRSVTTSAINEESVSRRLAALDEAHAWSESGDGFLLRIVHKDEVVGGLEIEGLAFPQYKEHYLNLALAVVAACGLAIANARAYDKITQTGVERDKLLNELQKALDDIRTLRGIIPICAHCKSVRNDEGFWEQVETYVCDHTEAEFSHGLCPKCAKELYPGIDLE